MINLCFMEVLFFIFKFGFLFLISFVVPCGCLLKYMPLNSMGENLLIGEACFVLLPSCCEKRLKLLFGLCMF